MQHLIKKHVLNGEFELVRQLMSETDFMEFEEAYISSAHEVESMMFYTCICLLYTSPSPRDRTRSRMPSSA